MPSEPDHSKATLGLRATLLTCAVLALAGAIALFLIFNTEPEVQREGAVRETAMLVDVTRPERGDFRPVIEAMGTVTPSREITLRPRVAGEVIAIAEQFVPGGLVRQGEVLLTIDDADYRIELAQRESDLQRAVAALDIEYGRQDMALQDYRDLGRELAPDKRALVLREPQLRAAEAEVEAARAAVERARLDLQRSVVKAPFDAQVLAREVAPGSQVAAGDALARLAGVDQYWIEATVPLEKIRWLSLPGEPGASSSPVRIRPRNGWSPGQNRDGRLFQFIGALDGETRLARLLVAVDDPLARQMPGVPPLVIGAFVECRIEGRQLKDTIRLPRTLIRQNDTVWLARDDRLAIQTVDIAFQDADYAYISSGLTDTDRVISTSLATVQEGTALRFKAATDAAEQRP